jgi:CBS domain containing-hemolysin-like protein
VGPLLIAGLTFFSTANIALRAPSRARMAALFEEEDEPRVWERFVRYRPQLTLATALLRAAGVLGVFALSMHVLVASDQNFALVRSGAAFALALFLVLVFSVGIPHAWAKYSGEHLVVRSLPVLHGVRLLLYPLVLLMMVFDPVIRRLCGVPLIDDAAREDEVQEMLTTVSEMERQGAVDPEEKEMIESVIELRGTLVEDIMTPRTQIAAIAKDATLSQVKEVLRNKGHSRYPVYDGTIDSILGMLYVKDILRLDSENEFSMTGMMRKALFIPETKPVRDLLRELKEQKVHVAVVLDEYGGTAGLVTIEDILEELVGDIADEYDTSQPAAVRRIDERTVEVDARIRIEDLNEALDLELDNDGDYETVGGLVFSTMGKIPRVGERCEHDGILLTVMAAEPNRVTRVRLTMAESAAKPGDD